jgi:mono/diheme cytochrome c family protein
MRWPWMLAVLLGTVVWVVTAAAADLELGKKVYEKKCAACHGADGKGNAKMEKALNAKIPPLAAAAEKTDAELLKLVSEGKKPMPSFQKGLSKDELEAVVHFAKGIATGKIAGPK